MTTIAVIGDVGGCAEQLARAVAAVEAEDREVVVVQVGDLVDRGPDTPGVLAFVGERLTGRRWVQLAGNHESQYLGAPLFWPKPLADRDADRLRDWWRRERLQVAAAVRTADGEELLLTHAGLSVRAWQELGEPVTAETAAALLNTRPEPLLWQDHGPLWAEAATGLYPGWLDGGRPMPFGQVHGHSAIVDYGRREWRCGERIRARSTVDWYARRTVTRAGGERFVAVDPRHGPRGAAEWAPLVLRDAELLG
ncbi:metallophosphoesterase [Dactylosporangium sp. NPDC005572]|uniref:metallophosphoesterase n=1 Tax=Dactylosporangium sp. NPDC005572 TaxID=3156889 RepID=UPI0033BC17B3